MPKPHSRSRPRLGAGTCGEIADAESTGTAAFAAGLPSALGPG